MSLKSISIHQVKLFSTWYLNFIWIMVERAQCTHYLIDSIFRNLLMTHGQKGGKVVGKGCDFMTLGYFETLLAPGKDMCL